MRRTGHGEREKRRRSEGRKGKLHLPNGSAAKKRGKGEDMRGETGRGRRKKTKPIERGKEDYRYFLH